MAKLKKAFTLVELLVVIAIISILAGMLMPALENAINSARTVSCMNNLKQTGLTATMYANDYNGWVQLAWVSGNGSRDQNPWVLLQEEYLGKSLTLNNLDTLDDIYKCSSRPTPASGNTSTQSGLGSLGYLKGHSLLDLAGFNTAFGVALPSDGAPDATTFPFFANILNLSGKPSGTFPGDATSATQIPIYGDCWANYSRSTNAGLHCVVQGFMGGSGSARSSFQLRHNNLINSWFIDGRVEAIDEGYAVFTLGFKTLVAEDNSGLGY